MTESISSTDVTNFKLCRQMWDYSSYLRQYVRPAFPAIKARRGSAYHKVLPWMFNNPAHTRSELEDIVHSALVEYNVTNIENEMKAVDILSEFKRYMAHHPLLKQITPQNIISIENRSVTPIYLPGGGEVNFVYYCDIIVEIKGKVYIIDFKTTTRIVSSPTKVFMDDQATTYSAAIYKKFGCQPTFVWVYLNTTKLQPPKLLKNGRFSRAKNQYLSMPKFVKAVEDSGQSRDFYSDFILHHSQRMLNKMFSVVPVKRNIAQLENCWSELTLLANEMISDPVIYTTNDHVLCKRCPYFDVCLHQRVGGSASRMLKLVSGFEDSSGGYNDDDSDN